MEGVMAAAQAKGNAGGWMDTILNLIPGRKQQASAEPSEEAIKRTHDYLRCATLLSISSPLLT
jgi:hypothetical protein